MDLDGGDGGQRGRRQPKPSRKVTESEESKAEEAREREEKRQRRQEQQKRKSASSANKGGKSSNKSKGGRKKKKTPGSRARSKSPPGEKLPPEAIPLAAPAGDPAASTTEVSAAAASLSRPTNTVANPPSASVAAVSTSGSAASTGGVATGGDAPSAAAAAPTNTATAAAASSTTTGAVLLSSKAASNVFINQTLTELIESAEGGIYYCTCGCGLNSQSEVVLKKVHDNQGRSDWDPEIKTCQEVTKGWVKLCPFGDTMYCALCKSLIKMKRLYNTNQWDRGNFQDGHRNTTKHQERVAAKIIRLDQEEKKRQKLLAEGVEVVEKPKKNKDALPQGSLMTFFKKVKKKDDTGTQRAETQSTGGTNPTAGGAAAARARSSSSVSSRSASVPGADQATSRTSSRSGGSYSCEGIIPANKGMWYHVELVYKYAVVVNENWNVREIGQTGKYNLYSLECEGKGIPRDRKTCAGVRCEKCQTLWTDGSSKLQRYLRKKHDRFHNILICLNVSVLTSEHAKTMENFTRIEDCHLKEPLGKNLRELVKHRLSFYRSCQETPITRSDPTGTSAGMVETDDPFLGKFIKTYQDNEEFRNSLIVQLMYLVLSKMNGHENPQIGVKALNFFCGAEAHNRATFSYISANLMGPCLRTVQRVNAKSRDSALVDVSPETISKRLTKRLDTILNDTHTPDGPIGFSLSFDGTKIPAALQLSSAYKAIIGGVYPQHFISLDGKTDDDITALMDPDSNIERAKEIKVAVLTSQVNIPRQSPMFVIAGQPQSLNMASNFNDVVTNVFLNLCKENPKARLVSVAADGVSVDGKWVVTTLVLFLKGRHSHTGLVDSNHNAKNYRYFYLGGSCVVIIGVCVLDPQLLVLAGVSEEIWRIRDWASDLVVLRLCSYSTVVKIAALFATEDHNSVTAMCVTLYFMRLKLYAVNARVLSFRDRVVFAWSSMIWLTSSDSQSLLGTNQSNMAINRRNMITETIAVVFTVMRDDVFNPRYITTESNEHTFGGWRSHRREATAEECCQIEDKRDRLVRAIFEGDLKVSRDPKKGYAATWASFVESGRGAVNGGAGPVSLSFEEGSRPACEQIWDHLGPIINALVPKMKSFLSRFGVKASSFSPMLQNFSSVSDLLEAYLTVVPSHYLSSDTAGSVSAVEEDASDILDSAPVGNPAGNIATLEDAVGLLRGQIQRDSNPSNAAGAGSGNNGSGPGSDDNGAGVAGDDVEVGGADDDVDDAVLGEIDDAVLFGDGGAESASSASSKFHSLLAKDTMEGILATTVEAIGELHFKKRESGSTSGLQKFNSLPGRWMVKDAGGGEVPGVVLKDGEHVIKRNTLVRANITTGSGASLMTSMADFCVTGIFTKYYNKWFLCNKGQQIWSAGMPEGKFRVMIRMVRYDHAAGRFELENPVSSQWETKTIYILADASDLKEVLGGLSAITGE